MLARALHEPAQPDPVVAFHATLAAFRARASVLHARLVSSRLFDGEFAFLREQLWASTSQIEHAARGVQASAQRYRADLAAIRRKVA